MITIKHASDESWFVAADGNYISPIRNQRTNGWVPLSPDKTDRRSSYFAYKHTDKKALWQTSIHSIWSIKYSHNELSS